MRVFLYELKKLWNWRILLIITVTGILTWFAFLLPEVRDYNNNANNIYGDWQNEMFDRYGITLSAEELADFDIPGRRAALEAEMNAIIAAEPLYAEYGIYTFDEYEVILQYDTDGMDDAEIQKYQADRAAMESLIYDLRSQWLELDNIEGYYVLFLERNIGMSRNGYSSIVTRAENHYINVTERNLTRYAIHDRFSFYAMVMGLFSVMKATIDREGCISCGLCASTCPEVFRMADDGRAEVCADPVPESAEDAAAEARDNCPVSVITVE